MPRARLVDIDRPDVLQLQRMLEAEWCSPTDDAEAPVIIVEGQGEDNASIHVIIVWDAWRDLGADARSEVIMSAFATVLEDQADLLRVTLALGVTPDEAEAMELRYQLLTETED